MSDFNLVLVIAAITAFVFRLVPFASHRVGGRAAANVPLKRLLAYSGQAMLGVLAFEILFGKSDLTEFTHNLDLPGGAALMLVAAAFLATVLSKRTLSVFALAASTYLAVLLFH